MKALAAAMLALALSCVGASADWLNYAGKPFAVAGLPAGHNAVAATVTYTHPLASYLTPRPGFPDPFTMEVAPGSGLVITVSDGVIAKSSDTAPAGPRYRFVMQGFLNPAHTDVDFAKGWMVAAQWDEPDTTQINIGASFMGTGGAVGATQDMAHTLVPPYGPSLTSYVNDAPGTWTHR